MSGFQSVGHVLKGMGWRERFDRAEEQMFERRLARIERYGFSPSCECDECGDTGTKPENGETCWCDIGRAIKHNEDLAASWSSLVLDMFVDWRLETHPNQRAVEQVRQWLDTGARRGAPLLLSGGTGTGKTGMAVGAMYELHMRGKRCMFDTMSNYLYGLFPADGFGPDKRIHPSELQGVPVLVIDDLGATKMSTFARDTLTNIIDARMGRVLPTIITTNVPMEELAPMVGERTWSRMNNSMQMVVLDGRDLRARRQEER